MDTQGNIRELKPGDELKPDEVGVNNREAQDLLLRPKSERHERLARLRGQDHHNQRRRKTAKLDAEAVNRTPRLRCMARNKAGHRCSENPHERGNHRAFGTEWK